MSSNAAPVKWGWIVFWIIVFWPVGIYLWISRSNVDKSALFTSSKGMTKTSYVLAGLAVLFFIAAFTSPSESAAKDGETTAAGMVGFALMFGVGAFVVFKYAKSLEAKANRYREYIALVVNERQSSIDNIAAAVGTTYDIALKELGKMIEANYFPGARIDRGEREIIVPVRSSSSEPASGLGGAPRVAAPQTRVVQCSGCGADNRIVVGGASSCEYCTSPLS